MSAQATGIIWDHFPPGPARMLTALALADGGDEFPIDPAEIADMTGQDEHEVRGHLRDMITTGWLVKSRKFNDTQLWRFALEHINASRGRQQDMRPREAEAA